MQRAILLTGSTSVENKKEYPFQLHQKKMSELIWPFLQVEGCRYCPVDTTAQGTHTDTCCELLKLVTSGSKLSISCCLLRNFMLLRPVPSLTNRIKDIHLKIGHRKKSQGELQLTGQDQNGLGTSRLVSYPPPSDCLFPQSWPGWSPLQSSQVGKWKLVLPHVSELHSRNCKSSPPLPLWGHSEHIRTGHDMEQTLPNPSSMDVLVVYCALLQSWSPTSPEFFTGG